MVKMNPKYSYTKMGCTVSLNLQISAKIFARGGNGIRSL